MALISDFLRALAQTSDPRFLGVVGKAVLLTLVVLVGVGVMFGYLVDWVAGQSITIPMLDADVALPDMLSGGLGILSGILLSVVLMVPVAGACIGLFLDEVVAAVEARHYPDLPPANGLSLSDAFVSSIGFLITVVVVNGFGLILYALSGPLAPLVFWAVNGYLLGREYTQMVAERRLSRADARTLRKSHMLGGWLSGTMMAVLLTIPLVGILVPVFGVAAATHRHHRIAGTVTRPARTVGSGS